MVPAPRGMRAVGDKARRPLTDPGVVGDATDVVGVMGFMWRPDTMAVAVAGVCESGERWGMAGRTFSRWACRYALLFCEGMFGNACVLAGLATRVRAGGDGNRLGLGASSGVVAEEGAWIGSINDSPLDSVSPRLSVGMLGSIWSILRST
jgi:hypothetical protein